MADLPTLRVPAEAIGIDEASQSRLPESARRVLDAVIRFAPVTHADLRDLTGIPARTIRYAVRRLRDEGIIDSRCSLQDCRTCYFFIHRDQILGDVSRQASVGSSPDEDAVPNWG